MSTKRGISIICHMVPAPTELDCVHALDVFSERWKKERYYRLALGNSAALYLPEHLPLSGSTDLIHWQ